MQTDFLWPKGLTPPAFPALEGSASPDVLIIGGGMAGILCALRLQEAGVNYLLVEGRRIGQGITRGTTAVLTAQHDTLYQDLLLRFGAEKAALHLRANLEAVEQFRRLAGGIPCDFQTIPSLMYTLCDRARLEREAAAVKALGFGAEFLPRPPLPFAAAGGVRYPAMAQFHPLRFLYGVARGLRIRENTFVERLDGTTAYTARGTIRARKVIVATHFPFVNRHGLYFMKLYQQRSFVIALENAPALDCTVDSADTAGVYLRNFNGLLLVGGGGRRTGRTGGGFAVPRAFARRYFPQAKEACAWANQDCVSLDGLPYIGPYSAHLPDVYVASGFGLWGMTTSMVAAGLLADLVLGKQNPLAALYSPRRNMFTGQLFANLGTTLLDFVSPTARRCPHLGCALRWDPAEHTWECPCHGSRFDAHGALLDGPALRDLPGR